jgi:hypothetical protein
MYICPVVIQEFLQISLFSHQRACIENNSVSQIKVVVHTSELERKPACFDTPNKLDFPFWNGIKPAADSQDLNDIRVPINPESVILRELYKNIRWNKWDLQQFITVRPFTSYNLNGQIGGAEFRDV